jgi:hypothetical protein
MNPLPRQKLFSLAARWLCALLAALALPINGFAQPKGPERWLFVFDLSATMKKRLPATEEVLKNFFATGAEGRLQDGDNIGIWTYDQKMHGGQFPLVIWNPQQAAPLTTNLIAFLRSRTFTGDSQMSVLQASLTSVITNSERLTVVIFCDGESDLAATPYDRGINQSFLDGRAERKKSAQPFVVLIRTLSGKFIGCTVNFPPGAINIPLFLAPPPPTNAPPPVVVTPVAKPAPVVVPDLVIVGKQVATAANPTPAASPLNTNLATSAAPKVGAQIAANLPPTSTPIQPASNHVIGVPPIKAESPSTATTTNPVSTTVANDSGRGTKHWLLIGGGGLAVVIVLVVIWLVRPGRRSQTSLITSSMQNDPRRK